MTQTNITEMNHLIQLDEKISQLQLVINDLVKFKNLNKNIKNLNKNINNLNKNINNLEKNVNILNKNIIEPQNSYKEYKQYRQFIIFDTKDNRKKVDDFLEKIEYHSKNIQSIDSNFKYIFSFEESNELFDSLYKKLKELTQENNEFNSTIMIFFEELFDNIVKYHMSKVLNEPFITKPLKNMDLIKFFIKYDDMFLNEKFNCDKHTKLLNVSLQKYLDFSSIDGCFVSWLYLAYYAKDMISDECYPFLNVNSIIYKNTNFELIKNDEILGELFTKYQEFSLP